MVSKMIIALLLPVWLFGQKKDSLTAYNYTWKSLGEPNSIMFTVVNNDMAYVAFYPSDSSIEVVNLDSIGAIRSVFNEVIRLSNERTMLLKVIDSLKKIIIKCKEQDDNLIQALSIGDKLSVQYAGSIQLRNWPDDSLHDRRYYDSLGKHWMIEYSYVIEKYLADTGRLTIKNTLRERDTIPSVPEGFQGVPPFESNIITDVNPFKGFHSHQHHPAHIEIIEYYANRQKVVWVGAGIYSEEPCASDNADIWIRRYLNNRANKK